MELVTTDSDGHQLFRLLPPGWEELVRMWSGNIYCVDSYQWRFGMNPKQGQLLDSISIGDIMYAFSELVYTANFNIHQYTLCWVGVPKKSVCGRHKQIDARRVVVYRAMTVDELRKTDDPMYRVVIACAIASEPDFFQHVPLVTELDCICFIMRIKSQSDLNKIPQYARTDVVRFFASIMFQYNTIIKTNKFGVELLVDTITHSYTPGELQHHFNEMYIPDLVGKPASELMFDLIERVSYEPPDGID